MMVDLRTCKTVLGPELQIKQTASTENESNTMSKVAGESIKNTNLKQASDSIENIENNEKSSDSNVKEVAEKENLKDYVAEEPKWECNACSEKFWSQNGLVYHLTKVHKPSHTDIIDKDHRGWVFKCRICTAEFKEKKEIQGRKISIAFSFVLISVFSSMIKKFVYCLSLYFSLVN